MIDCGLVNIDDGNSIYTRLYMYSPENTSSNAKGGWCLKPNKIINNKFKFQDIIFI